MKKWPLNSAMLSTTTHNKLREALDGTDTQVTTCVINKWTAKMKGAEEYITREISWRLGGQFERHQKTLMVQYQRRRRRTHPRMRPEDGLWPSPQLRCWRSCSPTILPGRWWSPRKGPVLKPAFLPNSLYWAIGFGFAHIYSERHPPNRDPTLWIIVIKLRFLST